MNSTKCIRLFAVLLVSILVPSLLQAHSVPCVNGDAAGFPCLRVDLMEEMALSTIGGGDGSDLWGWTDPMTGKEYALMGRSNGTAFVDISDPEEPVYLGNLPTQSISTPWRDIKTYQNYALIVADSSGNHGLQIFDLTQLRNVVNPPVTFTATVVYNGFGEAHNIVVDEVSGFAYAVGGDTCSGGLEMIDIHDPLNPTSAGCFSADGYTHDAQCVAYLGPDPDHQGKQICFGANTDTLTIVDVTVKAAPVQLSRTSYVGVGYTHQGWLTEDHEYFLINDEFDESINGHNTRTYVWDVRNLDAPLMIGTYTGPTAATDHNLYIKGNFAYEANYQAGLRILDISDVANANLSEVAFFDIHPDSNNSGTGGGGAWSVYPYFESGNVIVSGIEEGLFILRPQLCTAPVVPADLAAVAAGDNQIDLSWTGTGDPKDTYSVYRSFGACPGGSFELVASGLTTTSFSDAVSGQVTYSYHVTATDPSGLCQSLSSTCASATTTGVCNAPPVFGGLQAVDNPGDPVCSLDLSWSAAAANCGPGVSYSVYRSTVSGFTPALGNRIATGVGGTSYTDNGVEGGEAYYYVVHAEDTGNGVEDANLVEVEGVPTGPIDDGGWMTSAEVGEPILDLDDSPGFAPAVVEEDLHTVELPVRVGAGEEGESVLHVGWEFSSARQHTGDRSYFSTYSNNQCTAAATPPLELTVGESATLSFWTVYDIESRWDGGVVQISTNGGSTWNQLTVSPPYPDTFRSSSDACGFATNTPSFTDTNLTWTQYTANLSAFAGSEVAIRWIFSTDGNATREGWYIDDIQITHAQVAGACTTGSALFEDGFEAGNANAWTVVVVDGGV